MNVTFFNFINNNTIIIIYGVSNYCVVPVFLSEIWSPQGLCMCVFYVCFGLCVMGLLATDYSFVIKSSGKTKVGIIFLWVNAKQTHNQLMPLPLDIGVLVLCVLQYRSNIAIL